MRKLSNKEQKQAKSGNAGKHAANAGGWAKNENESTQTVSIEASWEEGATRPAVSRSRKRKRQQKASISNNNGNEETWSLFDAPESSRQPRPEKRRRVREPAPSVIHAPQNPYAAPTDANAFIDPVLRSQPSVHDHGSSFGPSPGVYGILPTEAAVGAYDPFPESRRVQNGWDGPAGYDSGTQSMDTLARPWFHNQQTVQGAQLGMTYPPVGVEYTSNDTGVPNNPWYNGPHISPSARYQSSFQPVDLEGTLKQHLDANSAQRRSAEEDVEESFLRAGIRNLAYRTRPTESYPPREIDYRTVLPRGAEDRNDIQSALAKTKCNFRLRTKTECPPTDTDQSYSYQVKQVLGRFERWWGVNGGLDPTPDLIICQTPWRYGFASWEGPTGGDLEFVNARLQELRATRGGRP